MNTDRRIRACNALENVKPTLTVSNNDKLAFDMNAVLCERYTPFPGVQHSRLGCGVSRFYRTY